MKRARSRSRSRSPPPDLIPDPEPARPLEFSPVPPRLQRQPWPASLLNDFIENFEWDGNLPAEIARDQIAAQIFNPALYIWADLPYSVTHRRETEQRETAVGLWLSHAIEPQEMRGIRPRVLNMFAETLVAPPPMSYKLEYFLARDQLYEFMEIHMTAPFFRNWLNAGMPLAAPVDFFDLNYADLPHAHALKAVYTNNLQQLLFGFSRSPTCDARVQRALCYFAKELGGQKDADRHSVLYTGSYRYQEDRMRGIDRARERITRSAEYDPPPEPAPDPDPEQEQDPDPDAPVAEPAKPAKPATPKIDPHRHVPFPVPPPGGTAYTKGDAMLLFNDVLLQILAEDDVDALIRFIDPAWFYLVPIAAVDAGVNALGETKIVNFFSFPEPFEISFRPTAPRCLAQFFEWLIAGRLAAGDDERLWGLLEELFTVCARLMSDATIGVLQRYEAEFAIHFPKNPDTIFEQIMFMGQLTPALGDFLFPHVKKLRETDLDAHDDVTRTAIYWALRSFQPNSIFLRAFEPTTETESLDEALRSAVFYDAFDQPSPDYTKYTCSLRDFRDTLDLIRNSPTLMEMNGDVAETVFPKRLVITDATPKDWFELLDDAVFQQIFVEKVSPWWPQDLPPGRAFDQVALELMGTFDYEPYGKWAGIFFAYIANDRDTMVVRDAFIDNSPTADLSRCILKGVRHMAITAFFLFKERNSGNVKHILDALDTCHLTEELVASLNRKLAPSLFGFYDATAGMRLVSSYINEAPFLNRYLVYNSATGGKTRYLAF